MTSPPTGLPSGGLNYPYMGGCVKMDMVYNLCMDDLFTLLKLTIFAFVMFHIALFCAEFQRFGLAKPSSSSQSIVKPREFSSQNTLDTPKFYYIIDLNPYHQPITN